MSAYTAKTDTRGIATSALVTHVTAIETAVLAVRTRHNDNRIDELFIHLNEVARLLHDLHL
jgi:hypothetical protein